MNNKKIGLVLRAGRSGTSVLTNILIAQGMIGSDDMIEASEANPKGGFEDKEIFQLQREVFNVLGLSGYAPLPNNFLKNADIRHYISTLREIITQRIVKGWYSKKDIRTIYHGLANIAGIKVDYAHHGPTTGNGTVGNWRR